MKLFHLLPLVALSTSFVLPNEQISKVLAKQQETAETLYDQLPSKDEIVAEIDSSFARVKEHSRNALDDAFAFVHKAEKKAKKQFKCLKSMSAFDAQSWVDSAVENDHMGIFDEDSEGGHHHHGPHHGHKHPHHGHKSNMTVYQLIANSKYTTKLAKLISEDGDLVKILNSTKSNFTVFAPTDKAFEKLPDHHKKPSKDLIKKVLLYHVVPDLYPAGRVLFSHTIPSALKVESLGNEPQRLRIGLGLRGLTVNFYSRIIAVNIFGSNGVIHGVDSLIFLPPPAVKIIEFLPGEFSTLELGLFKTGLDKSIAEAPHVGGTLFAPSNWAFQKLGPRINAFLFSHYGQKYLKALLKYHIVANETLYSDAYYSSNEKSETSTGYRNLHFDLPTALCGHSLSVDVARWGRIIDVRINAFTSVTQQDGIASDGVIHGLSSVLIPPKTKLDGGVEMWMGEELEVEDLKERLEPFVEKEVKMIEWYKQKLDL